MLTSSEFTIEGMIEVMLQDLKQKGRLIVNYKQNLIDIVD